MRGHKITKSAFSQARFAWRIPTLPFASWVLLLGAVLFIVPTMINVARDSWSTEQGAHGPIVLMTGLWLMVRELRQHPFVAAPGSARLVIVLSVPLLVLFCLARISGITEIEAFTMYGVLIVIAYALWGFTFIKVTWFPLIYLAFIFPPPNTVFDLMTQPMKIFISFASTALLQNFGYPIVNSGVTIAIGQYQMLVAAACAGLNSLISLSAMGLFYTYLRHSSNLAHMLVLVVLIIPIAIFANIIRVLLLLLITYHFGEAAGQGFFHEMAGLTMFASALLAIFGVDAIIIAIERRSGRKVMA